MGIAENAVGRIIGDRYRVDSVLGCGGAGVVYAVTDLGTGDHVALKELVREGGTLARDLFEREYVTLASLHHPCIVEVYEFGLCEGRPYYTMEILHGSDLSERAPMPWRQVCGSLRDAASVLGVLHARRMAHRDLSPRNLWRSHDGRIKLLDFGAMTPFGITTNVVGTPPLVSPEAFARAAVDARSDLFALGALGYWLLTSTHAYRAGSLAELPHAWQREPAVPSELVRLIQSAEHDVPPELDELLLSLLALDHDERPANTTEVIDRLNDIAELEPEVHDEVVYGYLESKAFVGRRAECQAIERQRALAAQAIPTSTFVEGPGGIGRSRLLEEVAMAARIAGTTVVRIGREAGTNPYAGAVALVFGLLRARPTLARRTVEPHAGVFADLSDSLRHELEGVGNGATLQGEKGRSTRMRKQSALRSWVLDLSRERTLTLVVDDGHLLDEESQALLVALALADRGHRLHLVVSASTDTALEEQPNLHALRQAARPMLLAPLSRADTVELLRSTFNDVSYLERLAVRLHAAAEGNPRDCLLLAEHLVRTEQIRYADGAWTLPRELPHSALPEGWREEGLVAALDHLSPPARMLARCLSVPEHGDFTEPMASAAAAMPSAVLQPHLQELQRHRILQSSASGYTFVHGALRNKLYAELTAQQRRDIHRSLAEHLAAEASDEPARTLRAVVHWLHAGDITRAEPLLFQVGLTQTKGVTAREAHRHTAPFFAEVVRLLRARGRDDHALYLPLTALTYAGIFVHRRYAEQFGPQAIETLSRGLRLPLAERLEPLLGPRLSLTLALALAGGALRRTPHAPDVKRLSYCLVAAATATASCDGLVLDPVSMRRRSAVLARLAVLKRSEVVRMLATLNEGLALDIEGHTYACQRVLREVIASLEDPSPELAAISGPYLAGARYILARNDALAHDERCLEKADGAEQQGGIYAVWANQVRALYWSNMGQLERAATYRNEVELSAIQLGSAWQVEMWELPMQLFSLTEDAAAMKRATVELERLASSLPHFSTFARWARAAYLVLRGRYSRALELYRGGSEPDGVQNWTVARAWFARAFNGAGQHDSACRLCTETLQRLSPEDREIFFHRLRLQVELAVAEVGLGRADRGHARLDALFEQYAPGKGPLVAGLLHCSRARLYLLQEDAEACHRSLDDAARIYAPLNIASLGELVGAMHRAASSQEGTTATRTGPLVHGPKDSHLLTRVQLYLSTATISNDANPLDKALQLALDLAQADRGFILEASGKCFSREGQDPAPEVVRWAESLLRRSSNDVDTEIMDESEHSTDDETTFELAGVAYRALCLWLPTGASFAAVVLGSAHSPPTNLPHDVQTRISDYLAAAHNLARSA